MRDVAETRWAPTPAGHELAYQVSGSGPWLLVQPDWLTNLETDASYWRPSEFFDRLSTIGTVLRIDARGTGLSDSVAASDLPTAEEIGDDTLGVLNAVDAQEVFIVAGGEGGLLATTLAATHPERVRGLVLVNCFPRFSATADYPNGPSADMVEAALHQARQNWGSGVSAEFWNPDLTATDPEYVKWLARWQRTVAGPSAAFALFRLMYLEMDVRGVLSSVQCPTLVIHRDRCRAIPLEHGQHLASEIPQATLRVTEGADGLMWGIGSEQVLDAIAEFTTGSRQTPATDRVLSTVLFTDIVDSTSLAAAEGDQRWKDLLRRHDTTASHEIERHRGRLIKSTGDGLLATFDGPGRAVDCARAILTAVASLGLHLRAGVHTGEIELSGADISGLAVHIAARVQAHAEPDQILVSRTVVDLTVGSRLRFADAGTHLLKGVPGEWQLYELEVDSSGS